MEPIHFHILMQLEIKLKVPVFFIPFGKEILMETGILLGIK